MPLEQKQKNYLANSIFLFRHAIVSLSLAVILYSSCKVVYVTGTEIETLRVSDQSSSPDQKLEDLVKPYRHQMEAEMNEVIGNLDHNLTKSQPESTLGNWLSDMLYEEVKLLNNGQLDFAIQNQGGMRVNEIGSGPISVGEVYEIMPFDNLVTIMWGNGDQIKRICDHIAEDGGWPVSHTLHFTIDNKKAKDILLHGEPLDPQKIYSFALPDYIANGGSGTDFLKEYKRDDRELLVRDAFINHIRKDGIQGIAQKAELDGRIKNFKNE